MSTPVGAVQGQNAHKGVKRSILGNPVGVPKQLPGFRGRLVDAGGPIKLPKLRNGNQNNETSNVRIPYNRVCPLEFLSSYQGRLGPGDVIFVHKYPPGFTKSLPGANNATLGVNTLSRVVGLDGMNRILMGSGPNGWRVGENVLHDPEERGAYDVLSSATDGVFALSALNEYRLDGVVISNDEPGAFMSSGSRDNAIFNVAIQGPVETNNGFLMYEDPIKSTTSLYNPLTGAINSRTVEAHARGSAESGMHIENTPMPGKVGSEFQKSRGKVDFVANFCGTYSMYPSQMFDRRVESLNTLYVGLRAYELSLDAKRQVTTATGEKVFAGKSDEFVALQKMYFYQFLPFSSRVASVVQEVTDVHFKMTKEALVIDSGGTSVPTNAQVYASMQSGLGATEGRARAARLVAAIKQQTSTHLPSAHFDTATYDPIRSEDMWNMVGAWRLGRVLDTKAAVHERYAGGPRDTAFSCIVDVGISWRAAQPVSSNADDALLNPSSRAGRGGKQTSTCLANNMVPALANVIGDDFGRDVRPPAESNESLGAKEASIREQQAQQAQAQSDENMRLTAKMDQYGKVDLQQVQATKDEVAASVRSSIRSVPKALELLAEGQFGTDPMVKMRSILASAGVTVEGTSPEVSEAAWKTFTLTKNGYNNAQTMGTNAARILAKKKMLDKTKSAWQTAARAEIKQILYATNDQREAVVSEVENYRDALLNAADVVAEKRDTVGNDSAKKLAYELELGKLLNRANHFLNLFGVVLVEYNVRLNSIKKPFPFENDDRSTDQALADTLLFSHIVHFSAMCDLHEHHMPLDDARFAPLAPVAPVAAPSPAPAPARDRKSVV